MKLFKSSHSKILEAESLYTIASYILTMDTTIQISRGLLETLKKRKINNKESYEEIIWDLLEDTEELSEETKKEIEEGRKEIERGEVTSLNKLKKKYGIE